MDITKIAKQVVVAQLKNLRETMIKEAVAEIIKRVPFFGLKFFNPIIYFFVEVTIDVAYKRAELYIDFTEIKVRVKLQVREWENALTRIENNEGNHDQNIEQARQALRELVRHTISD